MLDHLRAKKILLLVAVAICLVLAFKIHAQAGDLWSAKLPNPDSFTKLVLVRDWQPATGYQFMARDGAPAGSYLHWSAVHTWLVQQIYWALHGLGFSPEQALLLAGGALAWGVLLAQQSIFRAKRPVCFSKRAQNQAALLLLLPALFLVLSLGSLVVENYFDPQDKTAEACQLAEISAQLNAMPATTLLVHLNQAPQLLWLSPHKVIAGNYHHNIQEISDVFTIWRSQAADARAQAIYKRRHLGGILVCAAPLSRGSRLESRLARGEHVAWLNGPRPMGSWYFYQAQND